MVTGPYGGLGGEWFTDWWESLDGVDYHPKRPPQQLNIWAGERVDMLQLLYGDYSGGHHGDHGGLLTRLRLYNGDTVVRVSGRAGVGPGAGVDQLTFYTARYCHCYIHSLSIDNHLCFSGRTLGPFGGAGGRPFDSGDFSSQGCHLAYISGRSGRRLDQLFLHWRCPKEKEFADMEPYDVGYDGSRSAAAQEQCCPWHLIFVTMLHTLIFVR